MIYYGTPAASCHRDLKPGTLERGQGVHVHLLSFFKGSKGRNSPL